MNVVNDTGCSWINDLDRRSNIKTLDKDKSCDWLIIGAGYTGLSAARKLSELHPNQKIIIVDAQLAGEGASGRNSGYLVDTTLNDGFTSNKELSNYKKKTDIYKLGINENALPMNPFVAGYFYGIGIDPLDDKIYAADPLDFSQDGIMWRYNSSTGTLIDSIRVGKFPNGIHLQ